METTKGLPRPKVEAAERLPRQKGEATEGLLRRKGEATEGLLTWKGQVKADISLRCVLLKSLYFIYNLYVYVGRCISCVQYRR